MGPNLEEKFKEIILNTDLIKYLKITKEADIPENSWLLAGAVRNTVWKYLYPDSRLEVNDVDIIYFDSETPIEMNEIFKARLTEISPDIKWDVANQFHIYEQKKDTAYHMPNGPYTSIEHSIIDFWFTVNTIAIRLNEKDEIEIMNADYLSDLFSGILRIMEFQKDNYQNWFLKKIEKITSRCSEIKVIR